MPETRRPRVYIVNKGGHDYSAAKKYGDLVPLTAGNQKRFNVSQHARQMIEAMHDSEPFDYILLSSMNILCSLATAIFASMHKRINLLLWLPRQECYMRRTVELEDLLAECNIVHSEEKE